MARIDYSVKGNPEITSKAMGSELHISSKKSREVCCKIKGMKVAEARKFLEDVIALKQAVPFKRHHDGTGHRKGPMAAGRYPVNASKEILKVLKNAESNAEYKGLEPTNMYIIHVAAQQGRIIHGFMPRARGRATPKDTDTVNIEMILSEVR
jgi:large subunit ribosomal protein L22